MTVSDPEKVPDVENLAGYEAALNEEHIRWFALAPERGEVLLPRSVSRSQGRVYQVTNWEHGQDRFEIVWVSES